MNTKHIILFGLILSFYFGCRSSGRDDASETYPEKTSHPNEDYVHVIHDDTLSLDSADSVAHFDDERFMSMAAQVGFAEIEGGKLAQIKTRNESVKGYGKMLMNDHDAAYQELKNVSVLTSYVLPDSPTTEQKRTLALLSTKKNHDFDTAYVNQMINDHEKAYKAFLLAAQNAQDNNLRSFALKNEPVLKKHLETAKRLKAQLAKP